MPILSKHSINVDKYLLQFMRHMVLYSTVLFIMGIQQILYVFLGHGNGGISYLRDYTTFANTLVRIYILFCKQRWIKLWNKWTSFRICELKWFNQIFFKKWFFQPKCHFQQCSLWWVIAGVCVFNWNHCIVINGSLGNSFWKNTPNEMTRTKNIEVW